MCFQNNFDFGLIPRLAREPVLLKTTSTSV
jgi:hypothetical protein